jgi:hypothetical protein
VSGSGLENNKTEEELKENLTYLEPVVTAGGNGHNWQEIRSMAIIRAFNNFFYTG